MPIIQKQGRDNHSNCKFLFIIELSLPITCLLFRCCELFEGSHTASAVAAKINEILKKFLIENKVKYIVSDSAANMVRGMIYYSIGLSLPIHGYLKFRSQESQRSPC